MYLFIYVYIPRHKYINNLKLLLSASSSHIYTDEKVGNKHANVC